MQKHRTNNRGIAAVGVLLIMVIAALVAFAGWYVWQSQHKSTKSSETANNQSGNAPTTKATDNTASETTTQPIDETADWKSYTRYGITFKYPQTWTLKAHDSVQSTATDLTSPDFPGTDGNRTGEQIEVSEGIYPQSGLNAENFKSKFIDSNSNDISDFKILTVNGNQAVQYFALKTRTTVFFLPNDKTITFNLDNYPDRAASSTTYNEMINTVTLQHE
jgi:hypothetical protein